MNRCVILIGLLVAIGCSKPAEPTKADSKAEIEKQLEDARAFRRNGAKKEALSSVSKALNVDESNVEARKLRASIYSDMGQDADALNDYGYVLTKNGENCDVLLSMVYLTIKNATKTEIKKQIETLDFLLRASNSSPSDMQKKMIHEHCRKLFNVDKTNRKDLDDLYDSIVITLYDLGANKKIASSKLYSLLSDAAFQHEVYVQKLLAIMKNADGLSKDEAIEKARIVTEQYQKIIQTRLGEIK